MENLSHGRFEVKSKELLEKMTQAHKDKKDEEGLKYGDEYIKLAENRLQSIEEKYKKEPNGNS